MRSDAGGRTARARSRVGHQDVDGFAVAREAANLDARLDATVDQIAAHDQRASQGNLAAVGVGVGGEGAQLDLAQLLVDDALGDLVELGFRGRRSGRPIDRQRRSCRRGRRAAGTERRSGRPRPVSGRGAVWPGPSLRARQARKGRRGCSPDDFRSGRAAALAGCARMSPARRQQALAPAARRCPARQPVLRQRPARQPRGCAWQPRTMA